MLPSVLGKAETETWPAPLLVHVVMFRKYPAVP